MQCRFKQTGFLLAVGALALLPACKHEGSAVQKQYMADRQNCREYAEATIGSSGVPGGNFYPGAEGEHIELVRQFARCMHKRGWAVNKPPEPDAE